MAVIAIEIVNAETNRVEHVIENSHTGGSYDRFYEGVLRKVDPERFYIREVEES